MIIIFLDLSGKQSAESLRMSLSHWILINVLAERINWILVMILSGWRSIIQWIFKQAFDWEVQERRAIDSGIRIRKMTFVHVTFVRSMFRSWMTRTSQDLPIADLCRWALSAIKICSIVSYLRNLKRNVIPLSQQILTNETSSLRYSCELDKRASIVTVNP